MKHLLVIWCCVFAFSTVLAKEKKISLEDIERDNLSNEKVAVRTPQKPAGSTPGQYGFLPVKTVNDYARQQPKQPYVQPQYVQEQRVQPQYVQEQSKQQFLQEQYAQEQLKQQLEQPQYVPEQRVQSQYVQTSKQYVQASKQYVQPQIKQQYVQPQYVQYATVPQQYYYPQQPQQQYQQYENVPYITDNSIAQQQQQQQYYTPQYVYLQQYTAPSTAIQTVVDPKGGLQYIMYIPTYPEQADTGSTYESTAQQEVVQPGIKYAPETTQQLPVQEQPNVPFYTPKHEPKSLLDSYVPSILQVQYYKQAQANAIRESLKDAAAVSPVKKAAEYQKVPNTLRQSYRQ